MQCKKKLRNLWHWWLAGWGACRYGFPSRKLLVIGVTGTSGKSTTVFLLRQLLEYAGFRVGSLSTIDFAIAGEQKMNDQKMTMLGRAQIQQFLRQMVDHHCQIAIVETTSEGIVQHRHRFISYDTVILTNLYPEHIESHGGFVPYKNAKKKLFAYVAKQFRKNINGKRIPKTAIVNGDIKEANEFLNFSFDKKIIFGGENIDEEAGYRLSGVALDKDGLHLKINDVVFETSLYGKHNAMNITAVVALARSLGIDWPLIQEAVSEFDSVPGRLEFIPEAEGHGFCVIVDYAFEPVAMAALYEVVHLLAPKRIIHVGGATGGGRDMARREPLGEIMGKHADIVIVTDEDPYDENPMDIMEAVARGARRSGKIDKKNLLIIRDRREAIEKALTLATRGDMILVTGKGSEQAMCIDGGKKIPWDDRTCVRDALSRGILAL